MTGQQIFDKFQWAAQIYGPGTSEFLYGNLLFDALRLYGEDRLFSLLLEAELTGKRVDIQYASGEDSAGDITRTLLVLR
jgi:hypothetical protein